VIELKERKDIAYHRGTSRDSYREFDLYFQSSSTLPLIIFVHGGAWRSEDKLDHSALARSLVSVTGLPVIVPNYRLSAQNNDIHHPIHAQDILECLLFVSSVPHDLPQVFDPSRIYLIGHSCGAHMLASILLDSSSISPALTPPPVILNAIRGVVFSEGIYDIDRLLVDFPGYRSWFIAAAFGDRPSYAAFNTAQLPLRSSGSTTQWLIIHSKGDTLVNLPQSEAMLAHLKSLYGDQLVEGNIELIEEHDAILSTRNYLRIVSDFINAGREK